MRGHRSVLGALATLAALVALLAAPSTDNTALGQSSPGGAEGCPDVEAPFADVPDDHFATGDIDCLYGLGIIQGVTATTFEPDSEVTRAQSAEIVARVWRTAGFDCPTTEAPFADVPDDHFATGDIDCLYGLNIIQGVTATTFNLTNITRAQLAAVVARFWRARPGGATPDPTPPTGGTTPDPTPPTGGTTPDPTPPTGGTTPDPTPPTGGTTPDPTPPTGGPTPDPTPPPDEVMDGEMYGVIVGPKLVECVGLAPRKCMVVDDQLFYDTIEGFQYEEGYIYRLKIVRDDRWPDRHEPPTDVSRYRYRLIKVISMTSVE